MTAYTARACKDKANLSDVFYDAAARLSVESANLPEDQKKVIQNISNTFVNIGQRIAVMIEKRKGVHTVWGNEDDRYPGHLKEKLEAGTSITITGKVPSGAVGRAADERVVEIATSAAEASDVTPLSVDPSQAGAAGSAAKVSREDHRHAHAVPATATTAATWYAANSKLDAAPGGGYITVREYKDMTDAAGSKHSSANMGGDDKYVAVSSGSTGVKPTTHPLLDGDRHSDTTAKTPPAKGDSIRGNAAGTDWEADTIGSNGQVRTVVAGQAAWAAAQGTTIPTGIILLWSGAVVDIPAIPGGWVLCDGNNSTPNLQDKFVVGAGNTYAVGANGGATTHTHTAHSDHGHGIAVDIGNGDIRRYALLGEDYVDTTTDALDNNHSTTSHLPPYYALCYIMKT